MYFQEISPGIFLGSDQKIHHKLNVCPYCGLQDAYNHAKYSDMCVACGDLYNLYTVRRSMRNRGKMTLKVARSHLETLETIKCRCEGGAKQFKHLQQDYEDTCEFIRVQELAETYRLEHLPRTRVDCEYCGASTTVIAGTNGPFRCEACQVTYGRYKELYGAVNTLDQDGCDELAGIIRYYIQQQKLKYRVPQIARGIAAVNKRIVDIGGERYGFYRGSDL